jgi:hypothetical protein
MKFLWAINIDGTLLFFFFLICLQKKGEGDLN